jgi:hypothetical protein
VLVERTACVDASVGPAPQRDFVSAVRTDTTATVSPGPLSSGPRSGAQQIRPASVFYAEDQTFKETGIRGTEGTWKREH